MLNHQTKANANSGDLVMEIVANTTKGQKRNNSSRASGVDGWLGGGRASTIV